MAILASAKVGKNYRITLPNEVRKHLDLNEDSTVIFFTISNEKGRVSFRKGV
jgi:AbrB family looped-hinge helix DNA binding protein